MSQVFPVQSSILDAAALAARVLPHYELPQPVSCRLLQPGDNDTYLVHTGNGGGRALHRYVLRVYRYRKHDVAAIQGEVDVLALMARSGIAVAPAISWTGRGASGGSTIAGWIATCGRWPHGWPSDATTPSTGTTEPGEPRPDRPGAARP